MVSRNVYIILLQMLIIIIVSVLFLYIRGGRRMTTREVNDIG